jgi:hypothetical protein
VLYSRNLANEVINGMNEKVKDSGSVSRAPVVYFNTAYSRMVEKTAPSPATSNARP